MKFYSIIRESAGRHDLMAIPYLGRVYPTVEDATNAAQEMYRSEQERYSYGYQQTVRYYVVQLAESIGEIKYDGR